jgi:predicted NBD/HSP70 family sugar kinase
MSLPTVAQNLKELTEQGLVEESGSFKSTGGRKAKALSFIHSARFSVGLNITKNNIVIVVVDLSGEVIDYKHIRMRFTNSEEYFINIGNLISQSISNAQIDTTKILGVGIALPSIISEDHKSVLYDYILGFDNGRCEKFSQHIPYPCIICNDANAGGTAEMWNCDSYTNVFYLSLSSSVGGSVFMDNKLNAGENQRCSEVGHMTIVPNGDECYCGKLGCVDAYCNTSILSNCCNGRLEEFFEEIQNGSPEHIHVWEKYLHYLAITINNLRMLFDCNIILGGYLGSYMDEHVDSLRNMIAERNTFEVNGSYLQVCRFKFEAAAVGAALMHIEPFINSI